MFDKNVSLDIPCPKCGAKVTKTLKEIEENPTVKCPNGHDFRIQGDGLTIGLKDTENSIKQWGKDMERKFNKR
jgi:DNA-directed RNA polymerase subunit RPC12/RpoP